VLAERCHFRHGLTGAGLDLALDVFAKTGRDAVGDPVLLFADLSHLRVRAEVDETYALRLRTGQKCVVITRDEAHAEIHGTVATVKQMMGAKTVFSHASTERKDLDVRQVLIQLPAGKELPVGLQVDVKIETGTQARLP